MSEGTFRLPPSYAQELIWLTERASPGGSAYNIPRTRRLAGPMNVPALRRAVDALAARHEILRTTYGFDGDHAVQVIHEAGPVDFEMVDLGSVAASEREAEAARYVRGRGARPFDLGAEAPFRVAVVRLSDTEHLLQIDSHHIAADGWSRDVMFRELNALYTAYETGADPVLTELPIQYADYAAWQREQMTGDRLAQLLAYWRAQLGDADFILDLPTDFPRPPVASTEGVMRSIELPAALTESIRKLGRAHEATVYMTLLAAYTTLLQRYTNRSDVLVGSPIAGRSAAETEGLIGYFANTIVQRARFASDPTFSELLSQVRESALGAYEHQEIPFEKLVLEIQGGQSLSHTPLFQVVFTMLEAAPASNALLGPLVMQSYAGEASTTKFDLTLFMSDRPEGLTLSLRGRADLFAATTIEQMLQRLQLILQIATADPSRKVSEYALLTPQEQSAIDAANDTAVDIGAPSTVSALIEAAADQGMDGPAVLFGEESISWRELEARANQLAAQLRAIRLGKGDAVGICLERSANAIIALVAVLKTGGCYVPLAPDAPAARLAQQLTECGARAVVTRAAFVDQLPSGIDVVAIDRDASQIASQPTTRASANAGPSDIAYVLFTSGSTGVPKGVAVTHANIVNYVRAISRVFAETPRATSGDGLNAIRGWSFALGSALTADLGNTSLFPALCTGGTLHVLPDSAVTEPGRYAEYMAKHSIDVLKLTPNHLRALIGDRSSRDLAAVLPKRWLVLGGEGLHWDLADRLANAGTCKVLNHYGPTETTVGASTWLLSRRSDSPYAATVPIGMPLANVQMHVLDSAHNAAPVGVPGELYIGGAGVASGYLNRPELTAERFVELRGLGRVYRTGDRARRHASGEIEFLGRVDHQVKVRGYRVELGEIEQVLGLFPGVAQAAVVLRESDASDPAVVAYVVARIGGYAAAHAERPSPERLKEWVAGRLPDYMVPAAVVMLDQLPLTANGKLDRAALPTPDTTMAAAVIVAPSSATEITLHQIWADALKRDPLTFGIADDFLSLGGHSLVAIRILGKISRTFGLRLPLRTLFDAPRIDQLAELIDVERQLAALDKMDSENAPSGATAEPSPDRG